MLETVFSALNALVLLLRPVVFGAGALAAVGALLSWSVRTRRIQPFSPTAKFIRERIDPLFVVPMERRVVRAGGTPASAPWWGLAAVVLGGLLLLSAVQFVRDQVYMFAYATQSGSLLVLLVRWTFGVLRIALFARVIASWVGGSPYSKWWRWAFVLTEPILAPLRRVVPTIGMIDITVIVAYFGLGLLESLILSVAR
jgi:YggT family protein